MRIAIASDHRGFHLKEKVISLLKSKGHEVIDDGPPSDSAVDYPDFAALVAKKVSSGEVERGILICGTGIGMAMVANKIPGVRAAVCHDTYSAERARKSNDAQVMAMGAQVIGPMLGRQLVDHWLASEFAGGRSQAKVDKIKQLDQAQKGG